MTSRSPTRIVVGVRKACFAETMSALTKSLSPRLGDLSGRRHASGGRGGLLRPFREGQFAVQRNIDGRSDQRRAEQSGQDSACQPAQADGPPVMRAALAIPGDWRLEAKIDRMTGARRERHEPNRPRESSCGGWRHDRPAWLSVIAMLTVGADSEECRLMNHSRHKRPSPCRRGREPSMNSPACNRPAWNSPACNCPSGPLEGRRREPDWRAPPLDRDRLPGETKLQAWKTSTNMA